MVKMIVGFCFFNEYELLRWRLDTWQGQHDVLIIAECDHTHQGEYRGEGAILSDEDFLQRLIDVAGGRPLPSGSGMPLIKRVKYELNPAFAKIVRESKGTSYHKNLCFAIEGFQRDAIADAVGILMEEGVASAEDLLVICDADEFVDVGVLKSLDWGGAMRGCRLLVVKSTLFYYSLQWKESDAWSHIKCLRLSDFLTFGKAGLGANSVRTMHLAPNVEELADKIGAMSTRMRAGWHLSYFGGVERIMAKLQAFSEIEARRDILGGEVGRVEDAKAKISDIIEGGVHVNGVKLIESDKEDYPPNYERLVEMFAGKI